MKDRRLQAAFLRQALLIAVPVVILSVVALYSLRLDKRGVEQDARERAQALVPGLADQWSKSAGKELETFLSDWYVSTFEPIALAWPEGSGITQVTDGPEVGRSHTVAPLPFLGQLRGRLLDGSVASPVDYPSLPVPPRWIGRLTGVQSGIWLKEEQAIFQRNDRAAAEKLLGDMKAGRMPEEALASAELSILLMRQTPGRDSILARQLVDLARTYPDADTSTGTPVADIALIQAVRRSPEESLANVARPELFHRVIAHPSFLTCEIVAAAVEATAGTRNESWARAMAAMWRAQEQVRPLIRQLLQVPADPAKRSTEVWLRDKDQLILAQRETVYFGKDYSVTLIPARALEAAFTKAFDEVRTRIPSYAAVCIEIEGKRWSVGTNGLELRDDRRADNELASDSKGMVAWGNLKPIAFHEKQISYLTPPDLDVRFTFSLELARPALLYARYGQRFWLMAGFILLATTAAGFGLASAWRAFQRQVRLAEMTSNFMSSVSHELRAPLASVRLMAESLDQGRVAENGKQKGYFHLIVQECRRLSSLVENVLDFSRIRQGRKSYEFEPVDVAALVRQTVQLMTPGAKERQVCLEITDSPSRECQPCWDGQAVQQALVNLIDNAVKHSPPGAAVQVRFEAIENKIRIRVSDQGPGIPEEEHKRIFEPFYRRGSELRRETRGIGIGLSIVKHVAEAHGGQVIVDSTPGHGSRFTLELPG